MNAAQGASHVRKAIVNGLNAGVKIKCNSTRTKDRSIGWMLDWEPIRAECFFNKHKRFCRMAPR